MEIEEGKKEILEPTKAEETNADTSVFEEINNKLDKVFGIVVKWEEYLNAIKNK